MKARILNKRGIVRYFQVENCLYKVCGSKHWVVNTNSNEHYYSFNQWREASRLLHEVLRLEEITTEQAKVLKPKML